MGRLVGYVELQKGPANKTDRMFPRHFDTMSCAARRSSSDAVVASTKNAHNRILWQSGLRTQMWRLMTKDSSMATWMKLLLLRAYPASALLFGVVIISKPLQVAED